MCKSLMRRLRFSACSLLLSLPVSGSQCFVGLEGGVSSVVVVGGGREGDLTGEADVVEEEKEDESRGRRRGGEGE